MLCDVVHAGSHEHNGSSSHRNALYRSLQSAAHTLHLPAATWQAVLALWLLDAALDSSNALWACQWAVQLLVARDVTFPNPSMVAATLRRLLFCNATTCASAYLDHAHVTLLQDAANLVRDLPVVTRIGEVRW